MSVASALPAAEAKFETALVAAVAVEPASAGFELAVRLGAVPPSRPLASPPTVWDSVPATPCVAPTTVAPTVPRLAPSSGDPPPAPASVLPTVAPTPLSSVEVAERAVWAVLPTVPTVALRVPPSAALV